MAHQNCGFNERYHYQKNEPKPGSFRSAVPNGRSSYNARQVYELRDEKLRVALLIALLSTIEEKNQADRFNAVAIHCEKQSRSCLRL